jgi:hypothetical protein
VPAYKYAKGDVPATPERGIIARDVRQRARAGNAVAFRWSLAQKAGSALAALTRDDAVLNRAEELSTKSSASLSQLLVDEALAKTDCGKCGWPTCRAYADAIASGRERALAKCEPGGAKATRDVNLLVQLRRGATPAQAATHAIAQTLRHHR